MKHLLERFGEDDPNILVVFVGAILVPDEVCLQSLGQAEPVVHLLQREGGQVFVADMLVGLAVCIVDSMDRGNPAVQLRKGEGVSAELHTAQ